MVFVPGLNETNLKGDTGLGVCSGDFRLLCERMRDEGHAVFVVSSSKGRRGDPKKNGDDTTLDNQGDIAANAKRLAAFISGSVRTKQGARVRPLLVGHSMGGLIARVAMGREETQAAGLFTIGTPHTGSWGADAMVTAASLPCAHPVCLAVKIAAQVGLATLGASAIRGLTNISRTLDNLTLPATGVPTWVFAGTASHGLGASGDCPAGTSYFFPHDGIVGCDSALGIGARLGPVTQRQADVWHQADLPGFGHHENHEFKDIRVLDAVAVAASSLPVAPSTRNARARTHRIRSVASPAGATARSSKIRARATITTHLVRTQTVQVKAAHPARFTAGDAFATKPFAATCASVKTDALPVADGLYALPAETLGCRRPTLDGAHDVGVVTTLADNRVIARSAAQVRGVIRVIVTASAPLAKAAVQIGRRRYNGRHRQGRLVITVHVKKHDSPLATITAVLGHHKYAAPLPIEHQ